MDSKTAPPEGKEPEGTVHARPVYYNRLRVLNPRGILAMVLYTAALIFYIWIRVTKTLGLAQYTCDPLNPKPLNFKPEPPCSVCAPCTRLHGAHRLALVLDQNSQQPGWLDQWFLVLAWFGAMVMCQCDVGVRC